MKRTLTALIIVLAATGTASANAEALFTSANHGTDRTVIADRIVQVIGDADVSVDIAVAHFNSERIADAVIALNQARNENADPDDDVRIRVLLDMGEYGDSRSQSRRLEAAGLDVRYKTYGMAFFHPQSQLMHHKYLLVDGDELVSGSYNWSDTAELKNYENVIHWHGRNIREHLEAFEEEFEHLWELDRESYPAFMEALEAQPGDPAYRRYVPIHWNSDYFGTPMTLTRDEVAVLRSAAASIGLYGSGSLGRRYYDRESGDSTSDGPRGTFLPEEPAAAAATAGTGDPDDEETHGITDALEDGAPGSADDGDN